MIRLPIFLYFPHPSQEVTAMLRSFRARSIAALLLVCSLTGCAAKKRPSYLFQNCRVEKREPAALSCRCNRAQAVGVDAKTGAVILHCE
jgi:hypothetical protein